MSCGEKYGLRIEAGGREDPMREGSGERHYAEIPTGIPTPAASGFVAVPVTDRLLTL